jgi:hypothetical protein
LVAAPRSAFAGGVPVIVADVDGVEHAAVARSEVEGRWNSAGELIHDFTVVWIDIVVTTAREPLGCPGR